MLKATAVDPTGPYIMTVPWSGCWIWMGAIAVNGYPVARLDGKATNVHRFSLEKKLGRKLGALDARHTCDVRDCVNPAHLVKGTRADNMADAKARGRVNKGEDRPLAKLTNQQAAAIRDRYAAGGITQQALADEYGVSRSAIGFVVTGTTYKHGKGA